jgi:hypothetical protein
MNASRGRRVLVYLFVILLVDGGEGVPHALDTLPPGQGLSVPVECEAGCVPEPREMRGCGIRRSRRPQYLHSDTVQCVFFLIGCGFKSVTRYCVISRRRFPVVSSQCTAQLGAMRQSVFRMKLMGAFANRSVPLADAVFAILNTEVSGFRYNFV